MSTSYLQRLRMFGRNVRLYLVASATLGFGYTGIYMAIFGLYLLRLGYGPAFVGLIQGIGLLAYAVFCLPAGTLGNRWGSRRALIVGMALLAGCFWLVPLAEFVPQAWRSTWLIATWTLVSVSAPVFTVNSGPFLMGATNSEERNHAFAMQTGLGPLTGFAGSLSGGFLPGLFARTIGVSLDHPAPYRYTLFVPAILFTAAIPALLATREVGAARKQEGAAQPGPAPLALIAVMGLVMLLRAAGEWAANVFFGVYLDGALGASTALIGSLVAVSRLVAGATALAMPPLAERIGKERIIGWGTVGVACGLLPLALVPHWGAAGAGYIGAVALASIANAALFVYGQESVPPAWRALMSGAISTGMGVGGAAIAIGGGQIVQALGYRGLFLTGASLSAVGATLFLVYFRIPRGELARHPVQGRDPRQGGAASEQQG